MALSLDITRGQPAVNPMPAQLQPQPQQTVVPTQVPMPQQVTPVQFEDVARRRELADLMSQIGTATTPVAGHLEGLTRIAQAGLGAWNAREAQDEQSTRTADASQALIDALSGIGAPPTPQDMGAAVEGYAAPAGQPAQGQPGAVSLAMGPTDGGMDLQGLIVNAASEFGVDPAYALATTSAESGGDPTITNRTGSSAHGLFQMIDSTWETYATRLGYDPVADRGNPEAQARAGAAFTADVQQQVGQALGRPPEPWEQYVGHLLGPGGASVVLGADPATPFAAAIQAAFPDNWQQVLEQNPNFAGYATVGDFEGAMQGVMGPRYQSAQERLGMQPAAPAPAGQPGAVSMAQGPTGTPSQAQLAAIASAMADPNAPPELRQIGGAAIGALLEQQMAPPPEFDPTDGAPDGMYFTDRSRTRVAQLRGMPSQPAIEFGDLPPDVRTRMATGQPMAEAAQAVIDAEALEDLPSISRVAIEAGYREGTPEYRQFLIDNYGRVRNEDMTAATAAIDGATVEGMAERWQSLQDIQPYLDRMEISLDRGARTGAFGETALFLRQMLDAAGFDGADDLAETEVLQAVQSYLGPRMRVTGSGSSSDRDVTIFMNSLPNLSRTVEGNRLIIDYMRRLSQRAQDEYRVARRHYNDNNGALSDAYFDELSALGPVFTAEERDGIISAAITPESIGDMTTDQIRDMVGQASSLPQATLELLQDEIARRAGQ